MTPGQVAYEKWAAQNATTRLWEHVHPTVKKQWERVAAAAIEWYKINNVVVAAPTECYSCRSANGAPCHCQ